MVLQHIHGCKEAWLPVQLHWARVSDTDPPPDHSPGHRALLPGPTLLWPSRLTSSVLSLGRTFSKTWEVKRSFMLALLQLYHYECGPQMGSCGLAPPARCHIGLLWDEPKYENPVGATGHSMVSLDFPTGLSSPNALFTWCPPKRSLWSLPYRHVLRHLGKLLGLPNLELTRLFGKILSFIGPCLTSWC